jgi:EAL domain-containing protein (putative c-di-GMP-specific phosphodiesterase class I)
MAVSDTALHSIHDVLAARAVRSVYQPIVDLETGVAVGYEALARGPEGSDLERPDRLFAAARDAGCVDELEWACRAAAVRGAAQGGLRPPLSLFVNAEPSMLTARVPEAYAAEAETAMAGLNVVIELTERALAADPATVLRRVERLRSLGCAIALDDVGAHPDSLALMPFIEPEVIKLDMALVQGRLSTAGARVVGAVAAEAERSGALIVAEGIQTEAHLSTARAMGAQLGQGYLFSRPGPLPDGFATPSIAIGGPRRTLATAPARTPFDVVSADRPVRRGTKALLLAISRQLEAQAWLQGDSAVVLATFQDAMYFTPASADRYRLLAEIGAFVGALGAGLGTEPVEGVRGASLAPGERLREEWDVAVIGPHFAAAFVARDLGDTRPDHLRRFDFALTHDRDLAVEAATALMLRIAANPSP